MTRGWFSRSAEATAHRTAPYQAAGLLGMKHLNRLLGSDGAMHAFHGRAVDLVFLHKPF